jgi:hypothetical protein
VALASGVAVAGLVAGFADSLVATVSDLMAVSMPLTVLVASSNLALAIVLMAFAVVRATVSWSSN